MMAGDSEPIPIGFRFHPTDEELINHYLKPKIQGEDSKVRVIPEVDICKFEPWDLPATFLRQFRRSSPYCSKIKSSDYRWYFFCARDVKNPNGTNRLSRSTEAGFWKPTGTDRKIKSRDSDDLIGTKKTLVFYTGRVRNSQRTSWVIHEYQLDGLNAHVLNSIRPPKKGFVLCLLKNKKNDCTRGEVEASSVNGNSPNENPVLPNNSSNTNYVAFDADNEGAEESVLELTPEEQEYLIRCLSEPTNQHLLGLQSQMYPEQGPSDMDFLCMNDFSNDNEEMQYQFDTMESDENDIDQYLVDQDEYTWAESNGHRNMAARRNEMPETHLVRVSSDCSLTKEYVDDCESSSETDTEQVYQSQVDPIVETIKSLNGNVGISQGDSSNSVRHIKQSFGLLHEESGGSSASSVQSRVDPIVEAINRSLNSGQVHSSNNPQYIREINGILHEESRGLRASSVQSRVDPIVEAINRSLNRQGGTSHGHSSDSIRVINQSFGFPHYESGGSSASSVDSIADKAVEIELTSPESPVNNTRTRTSRSQYELKSHSLVAQGSAPRRICLQDLLLKEPNQVKVRDSSSYNTEKHEGRPDAIKAKASAAKVTQREKSIVVSNRDSGTARDGPTKLSLNSRGKEGSGGNNQTGSTNSLETPLASSHRSSPDVYFSNVLVGVIFLGLFFVFVVLDLKDRISSVFN